MSYTETIFLNVYILQNNIILQSTRFCALGQREYVTIIKKSLRMFEDLASGFKVNTVNSGY
jgi:hypothetical protein